MQLLFFFLVILDSSNEQNQQYQNLENYVSHNTDPHNHKTKSNISPHMDLLREGWCNYLLLYKSLI